VSRLPDQSARSLNADNEFFPFPIHFFAIMFPPSFSLAMSISQLAERYQIPMMPLLTSIFSLERFPIGFLNQRRALRQAARDISVLHSDNLFPSFSTGLPLHGQTWTSAKCLYIFDLPLRFSALSLWTFVNRRSLSAPALPFKRNAPARSSLSSLPFRN